MYLRLKIYFLGAFPCSSLQQKVEHVNFTTHSTELAKNDVTPVVFCFFLILIVPAAGLAGQETQLPTTLWQGLLLHGCETRSMVILRCGFMGLFHGIIMGIYRNFVDFIITKLDL